MSAPTPQKKRPIIEGVRRMTGIKRDIVLWPEEKKNLTAEQLQSMSQEQIERILKVRDLHGYLLISRDGATAGEPPLRISVSAWIHEEPGQVPRLKVMGDLHSGQGLLGSLRPMLRYNGQDANGRFGLRFIGDMNVDIQGAREKFTITGTINESFPDRDLMLDAGRVFGFPERMIEQFRDKLSANAVAAADRARQMLESCTTSRTYAPTPG